MSTLSLAQIQALAASVGFPNPNLAAAVAMAESGGNTNAYGDAQYGGSLGLWQINLPWHPQYQANPNALYDPTFNAKAALAISSDGTNWNPWTMYRNGAYMRWYTAPSTVPVSATPTTNWQALGLAVLVLGVAGAAAYTISPHRKRRAWPKTMRRRAA
jgi:hypothetical protein